MMRAVQVTEPGGPLELVEREVPEPEAGHVRIRVEACGVCHSDSFTAEGAFPGIAYPRVPGHEVAGVIDALGADVAGWEVGQRVGVGWHFGHCGRCHSCRRGDFVACDRGQITGISHDGGYADFLVAPVDGLARIPDELSAVEAAPLLCAGNTTFNALRHSGAVAGDTVAVLGISGLGHLGIQFARRMGFRAIAIARGTDKEPLARQLGAHQYIDSQSQDVVGELLAWGGAKVVLATATSSDAMAATLPGLAVDGKLIVLGAAAEPVALRPFDPIAKRQSIAGWPSGTALDSEDALAFCALTGVRSMNQVFPLQQAQEAYDLMLSGHARFRAVLSMAG